MRVLIPDTETEKLYFENTTFLISHFYDKKIHFPAMWDVEIYPGIDVLKKSLEIIKSKDYDPDYFRDKVLFTSNKFAPEFWKDLYYLQWYEERKTAIESLLESEPKDFENKIHGEGVLIKKIYSEENEGTKENLKELTEIIELSKELQTLINKDLPNLEKEFNQRLQRYEEKKAFDEERRKLRKQRIKTQPQPDDKQKPELSINQIALKYFYENKSITRDNGNEIAIQHGHNSGEKLFQRFTFFSSTTNRTGRPTPCTPKKLNNKIQLFEGVILLLPKNSQQRAKDEIQILKNIYDTEYQ